MIDLHIKRVIDGDSSLENAKIVLGQVYRVHRDKKTVDVIDLRGGLFYNCFYGGVGASSETGMDYLPELSYTDSSLTDSEKCEQNKSAKGVTPEIRVVVVFPNGNTSFGFVAQFLYPITNSFGFDNKDPRYQGLSINVHQSGTVELTDKDGNTQLHLPDGSYIRIANSKAELALNGQNHLNNIKPFAYKTDGTKKNIYIVLSEGLEVELNNTAKTVTVMGTKITFDTDTTETTGMVKLSGDKGVARISDRIMSRGHYVQTGRIITGSVNTTAK